MAKDPDIVRAAVTKLQSQLSEFRVKADLRDVYTPGYKFNDWELKGVPVRLEIGPRDVANDAVVAVRRDTGIKVTVPLSDLVSWLNQTFAEQQTAALAKTKQFTATHTHMVDSYTAFKEIMASDRGFIRAFWCEDPACEAAIKTETKATTRCLPLDAVDESGSCIYCGKPAIHRWYFAQAY